MTTTSNTRVTRILKNPGEASRLLRRCFLLKPAKRARWSKASRFTKAVVNIGSSQENDLVLSEPSVSRHHARIDICDDLLSITDLSSSNGTFVNDVRVLRCYLSDRCTLRFGGSEVAFRLGDESEEVALSDRDRFGSFLGESVEVRRLFQELTKLAASDASVLLEGESGTGKEVLAQAIHDESARNTAPFITVDCGALPHGLIESELFGHERGAFTGAVSSRAGAFELAHGGTLFLDEIGELDVTLQPKLLRALEQRSVRRVGGEQDIQLDVRIVAATNRDLHHQMASGEFREDLYYRLAVAHLRVPPLRERREDIPMLARHLLASFQSDAPHLPAFSLTSEVLNSLQARPWRGNVRELRNVLQRAFVTSDLEVPSASEADSEFVPLRDVPTEIPYQEARDIISSRFEQTYLRSALDRNKWNVAKTARECCMDRATLFRLLKKHGIKRPT